MTNIFTWKKYNVKEKCGLISFSFYSRQRKRGRERERKNLLKMGNKLCCCGKNSGFVCMLISLQQIIVPWLGIATIFVSFNLGKRRRGEEMPSMNHFFDCLFWFDFICLFVWYAVCMSVLCTLYMLMACGAALIGVYVWTWFGVCVRKMWLFNEKWRLPDRAPICSWNRFERNENYKSGVSLSSLNSFRV